MPGTITHSDSTAFDRLPEELADVVDQSLDLFATVWLPSTDDAECYHAHRGALGPGCPEHRHDLERGMLVDAAERGLRPCGNCKPENYRRIETDGGEDHCAECGSLLPDEIDEGTGVYCPSCGHGQLVTDGGVKIQAVNRVKDAHRHILGLASAAAAGDDVDVEEHADEVRTALDDVESLIVEDGEET